jgi:hypothetical protein
MASVVYSPMGRRLVPGKCLHCGADDDWDVDGRGSVYCSCQCCSGCGSHDGHWADCPDNKAEPTHDLGCCCDECNPEYHRENCTHCNGEALTADADHAYESRDERGKGEN